MQVANFLREKFLQRTNFFMRKFLQNTYIHLNSPPSLHVHSRPLDVVYSRFTTDKLFRFLRNPWAGERGGAQLGAELRSHTTAGIRHRLEELLEGEKKVNCNLYFSFIVAPQREREGQKVRVKSVTHHNSLPKGVKEMIELLCFIAGR